MGGTIGKPTHHKITRIFIKIFCELLKIYPLVVDILGDQ